MTCRHGGCVLDHIPRIGALWCRICKDYVLLGPANDTPPVLVEARAARLAQDDGWIEANGAEVRGWNGGLDGLIAEAEGDAYACPVPSDEDEDRDGWHAGYLAHAIAHHDEEAEQMAKERA